MKKTDVHKIGERGVQIYKIIIKLYYWFMELHAWRNYYYNINFHLYKTMPPNDLQHKLNLQFGNISFFKKRIATGEICLNKSKNNERILSVLTILKQIHTFIGTSASSLNFWAEPSTLSSVPFFIRRTLTNFLSPPYRTRSDYYHADLNVLGYIFCRT